MARQSIRTAHVQLIRSENGHAVLGVDSGSYQFVANSSLAAATVALKTSKPKDNSINPEGLDLTTAKQLARWDFSNEADRQQWSERADVEIVVRDGKAYLVADGKDSRMAVKLNEPLSGKLVIELKANPGKGAESQFFWAHASSGFKGSQQTKRRLMESDTVHAYLFSIEGKQPITKLRFDPFATYDEYANKAEMEVESIAVYRLPD